MSAAGALFTPGELRRLDRLRLRRRRPAPTDHPGDWRTARVGAGILFADHRDYVPGDDLRYVDWNVYARLGDLMVKRFESEETLDLLLCVDRSLSMGAAKSRKARRVAGALGYIALAHLERVRLAWMPAVSSLPVTIHAGRGRMGALLDELSATPDGGVTAHARDVSRILGVTKRRGMAVVVSDFYEPGNAVAALAGLRSRGTDVVAVHVLEKADVELPVGASLRAVDRESGAELKIDVTPAFLESLHATWLRRADSLERWCVTREILYQRVEVKTPLWDVLGDLLGRGVTVGVAR